MLCCPQFSKFPSYFSISFSSLKSNKEPTKMAPLASPLLRVFQSGMLKYYSPLIRWSLLRGKIDPFCFVFSHVLTSYLLRLLRVRKVSQRRKTFFRMASASEQLAVTQHLQQQIEE